MFKPDSLILSTQCRQPCFMWKCLPVFHCANRSVSSIKRDKKGLTKKQTVKNQTEIYL